MAIYINKLVDSLLSSLSKRQQEILLNRYGLHNGREMTLAALGKRYRVTRERIRQVQNMGLETLQKNASRNGLTEFATLASTHFNNLGGVRREADLNHDAIGLVADSGDKKTLPNRVRFLIEAAAIANFRPADKAFHGLWFTNENNLQTAFNFVSALYEAAVAQKETILADKKFDVVFGEVASTQKLKEAVATNFVALSKKFLVNNFGEAGLVEWPEINPRTSRDFALVVLKKEGKPLHFTTIAERIGKIRQNRKTNFQTVHNELIKDSRFVLVGRGMYGLAEFGLLAGTAREVMAHFLKEHGPLKSKELVDLVLAKREFKENTLLLGLQNKMHFQRLDDGRYTVREV